MVYFINSLLQKNTSKRTEVVIEYTTDQLKVLKDSLVNYSSDKGFVRALAEAIDDKMEI